MTFWRGTSFSKDKIVIFLSTVFFVQICMTRMIISCGDHMCNLCTTVKGLSNKMRTRVTSIRCWFVYPNIQMLVCLIWHLDARWSDLALRLGKKQIRSKAWHAASTGCSNQTPGSKAWHAASRFGQKRSLIST
jgi:hypothetical protein